MLDVQLEDADEAAHTSDDSGLEGVAPPPPEEPAPEAGTTQYGWCMSGDHDTGQGRGGCPIQAGTTPACACACHGGATEPRGYLPIPDAAPALSE